MKRRRLCTAWVVKATISRRSLIHRSRSELLDVHYTFGRSYGNLWAYSEGENGVRVETLEDWIVFSKDIPAFSELHHARQRVLQETRGELGTRRCVVSLESSEGESGMI